MAHTKIQRELNKKIDGLTREQLYEFVASWRGMSVDEYKERCSFSFDFELRDYAKDLVKRGIR